jgi:aryl-alcohol dehydrogenase-like predicted oxidoreductase
VSFETRTIGDRSIYPIGFGGAGLSVGAPPPDRDGVAVVVAALEAGFRLLDTAACYVPDEHQQGHNEALLAKAVAEWGGDPDEVLIATKCGIRRIGSVAFETDFVTSGRPEHIRRDCDDSLAALGLDRIALYQLHTPDPNVAIEETVGAMRELQTAGKIQHIGLSNVDVELLDRARAVADIAVVQNRFSPAVPDNLPVIRACEERGVTFLAYSPLGGLGQRARELFAAVPVLTAIADTHGVSPHQVALAWELAVSPVVIPIPGARRIETARDSAAAAQLQLSGEEVEQITAAVTAG